MLWNLSSMFTNFIISYLFEMSIIFLLLSGFSHRWVHEYWAHENLSWLIIFLIGESKDASWLHNVEPRNHLIAKTIKIWYKFLFFYHVLMNNKLYNNVFFLTVGLVQWTLLQKSLVRTLIIFNIFEFFYIVSQNQAHRSFHIFYF